MEKLRIKPLLAKSYETVKRHQFKTLLTGFIFLMIFIVFIIEISINKELVASFGNFYAQNWPAFFIRGFTVYLILAMLMLPLVYFLFVLVKKGEAGRKDIMPGAKIIVNYFILSAGLTAADVIFEYVCYAAAWHAANYAVNALSLYSLADVIFSFIQYGMFLAVMILLLGVFISFSMVSYFIFDGNGIFSSLKKSAAVTKGCRAKLFVFLSVVTLIFYGSVIFILPVIITFPFFMLIAAIVYFELLRLYEINNGKQINV